MDWVTFSNRLGLFLVIGIIFGAAVLYFGLWGTLSVIGIYIVYKLLGETSGIRGGDHGGPDQ